MGVLELLESMIVTANGILWGAPLFIMILGVGLLLTIRLGGIQVRLFPMAILRLTRSIHEKNDGREGDISPFQALSTALSGTMGIGNIAGVSTAIVLGGPGADFWMWMTAVIGMATKYAEAVLALKYRVRNADGTMAGGPMYYIEKGLKNRWLALAFAGCAAIATVGGGGMAQANSIANGISYQLGVDWAMPLPIIGQVSAIGILVGLTLTLFTGLVIIGGIKRIGIVASWLIPFLSIFYVGGGMLVMLASYDRVPGAIGLIFQYAFSPYAVAGGALGYSVVEAIRYGVARGVFTNEAGLGSAPVAYAASKSRSPVDQGLLAMLEVFIDTLVTCSITAFAVLSSDMWDDGLTGTALTTEAFSRTLGPAGAFIVLTSTILFGFSTIIGWSYYGEQYSAYIFGHRHKNGFKALYLISVFAGSVLGVRLVWEIADLFNGLMAIPNLVALAALSGVVSLETKKYFGQGLELEPIPPKK
ncbi:amino acid carrier protein (sodium:alanine symporter family) [Methanocella conradii HZ254]|uniref:Amino acid carrier protein (Sodium:alanine symporter family) n=1 Tax=Methanocella conradii (strain DSM 24694 / JCM 17849 / CGMCC 1.5162 / HZ254) TaxID=1041930 RepID=H8I7A1_METCZ|nr:sodium:alanine symporter family protein [Methanocella conradii]AFD00767.1 amino acid carrier protein (sodium:alanine symporter family) [Methanocella conradii HZ254]